MELMEPLLKVLPCLGLENLEHVRLYLYIGRLTLVEGGLVWRLVAGTWAFVVTLLRRLMRIYTPKDTGATVCIAARPYS